MEGATGSEEGGGIDGGAGSEEGGGDSGRGWIIGGGKRVGLDHRRGIEGGA